MFDIFQMLFGWLPPPLPTILFGALCLLLLIAIIKLVAKVLDMIPFL